MSRSTLHPTTTTALRDLDPAPDRPLTADEQQRADRTLERILGTDDGLPGPAVTPPSVPVRSGRRSAVRWAALGAAASLTAVAGTVTYEATSPERAYATWTATPQAPTTQQQADAEQQCRDTLLDAGTGVASAAALRSTSLVLSERRGDATFIVLAGGGAEGHCLTLDAPLGRGSTTGAVGTSGPAPTPRGIDLAAWGTAVHGDHGVGQLVGRVGPDVAAVVVHTADRGDVTATVDGGYLAAWWPVDLDATDDLDAVPAATVTYRDGSTETGPLDGLPGVRAS